MRNSRFNLGTYVLFVVAVAMVAFSMALSSVRASITPSAVRPLVKLLPDVAVAPSPGFTIGGKTVAWGSTVTLTPADTSTTQRKFADGFCNFDFSFNVANVGIAKMADAGAGWVWYETIGSGGQGFPALNPGQTWTVKDWVGMKPGIHQLTAHAGYAYPELSNTNNSATVTAIVTGVCAPRGTYAPPFSHILKATPTPP